MKIFSGSANIFLGRLPKRASGTIKWPELFDETARLLSDFEVALDPHRQIDSLGMAERQLVEVAKALSMEALIPLLDEPTSALSYEERDRLFEILRRLQNRGVGSSTCPTAWTRFQR
jgi:ribose transport system ATP-binding protein